MGIANDLVSTLTLCRALLEDNEVHYIHDVRLRVIHMMVNDALSGKSAFWTKYLRELEAKADKQHAA